VGVVGVGTRLVARAALGATRLFYTVSRQGPALPDGPVLVVANHPNSVLDALVVFLVAGRPVHPLARAPLFERPVIGQVLRELGGLPVYRPQDDPRLVGRNDSTFDAAIAALRDGSAVLVFPEGTSHSQPELAPLKTGAARIALGAEKASDWTLGIAIVPIGLTYRRKTLFRGEVAACVGEALRIPGRRHEYERDEHAAVRALTATIADRLESVTLQLRGPEDEALLDAAEALYVAERGLEPPGETPELAERLPRLQVFAAGTNWLRAHDPERFARLALGVRAHGARLARLGMKDADLSERSGRFAALRALGRDGVLGILAVPLAVVGLVAWSVPFALPRLVLPLVRPAHEAIATVKLVTALIVFPLAYAGWLILAWQTGGVWACVLAAVLLPIAGIVALHARSHWEELRADARFLVLSLQQRTARLRARRAALAEEIDRVASEWEAESRRRAVSPP
jgi:1-acyl-sn-glycerol-3-phosphate acyltransferase